MASSTKNTKQKRSAKTWKRAGTEEVALPSGNTCVAKRPGPAALLQNGMMPDALLPIVQEGIRSNKGLPPEKTEELLKDPKSLAGMLDAMDKMLVLIVVEPEVKYHRRTVMDPVTNEPKRLSNGDEAWETIPEDERDEDLLYTDEVDLEDKTFLFNFAVGGTRDFERFRAEQRAAMGDVDPQPEPARSPKRTSRSRGPVDSVLPGPGGDALR